MQRKNFDPQHRAYLDNNVSPLLERMIGEMLASMPRSPVNLLIIQVEFMVNWLNKNGENILNEHQEQIRRSSLKPKNAYGESSSEESEDEYVDELEFRSKSQVQAAKPMRTSVSAEAYGQFNKKADYKPRYIPKTPQQIDRLKERMRQAFMFNALDEQDQEIVINAFEEKMGETIINQGDDGDELYVVDQGELDCYKRFSGSDDNKFLKTYVPGEAFGELALLYNAPRAATIIAKTSCVLFALDRACFNHIVKEAASKKRESYEKFLGSIELLDQMDPYEKSKIADALKPSKFLKGEYVVKEGERGDSFFFVEFGEAVATKTIVPGQSPQIVYDYKPGDYFGELALLKDTPRAANIIAKTDLTLVSLDRNSFKRLLGPLDEILKRNFARYEKFVS